MCLLFLHSVRDAHWQVEMQRCCAGKEIWGLITYDWMDIILLWQRGDASAPVAAVSVSLTLLTYRICSQHKQKPLWQVTQSISPLFYTTGWCFLAAEQTIHSTHVDKHRLACLFVWCSLYLVKGGATTGLPSIYYKSIFISLNMLRIIVAGRQWLCCHVLILDCIDLTNIVWVCNIRGRRKEALGKQHIGTWF